MFFLFVIIVLAFMYGYVGWRIIIPAAFSLPVNVLLWVLLMLFLVMPFVPVILRMNGVEGRLVDVAAWAGYLSFGFFTLLFAVLITKDLALLVATGIQKSAQMFRSGGAEVVADPQRRLLMMNSINLGVLGFTVGLMGYGIFEALRRPRVVEVTVPIKNLHPDLNGFRIVQITDIHVSHTIKRPFVQDVVDTVNRLQPDLIALTGDLADGSVSQLGHDVAPLADLKAPHGRFFITGNHEYYSGVQQRLDETARLGFDVLLNEHRVIEKGEGRFLLAGVTDYSGGQFSEDHRSDPHKALKGASDSGVKILLAHQPRSIFEAAKAGYDFVISGHTHGGQYFPYHILAYLTQPYISGLHKHGDTLIYVSRGTGYWGPQLRIGARSEITVHRIVSA